MDSALADRIAARRTTAPEDETDTVDDRGSYACTRSRDCCLMVDFRFLNGDRVAFAYATLERVSYEPSEGIMLAFLGVKVLLRGRNLAASPAGGLGLLDSLHRYRVPWVRETEQLRAGMLPADVTLVNKIDIDA